MTQTMTKRETSATPRRWFEGGPLSTLRDEMDELVSNFFGGVPSAVIGAPSIDISETEDSVEVTTDLPGYKADQINVEVNDNYLTISGETSEEKNVENGNGRKFHRVERRHGSFSRSVRLPCNVDQDNTDAELKDGVLTVTLRKADDARSKKIAIKG